MTQAHSNFQSSDAVRVDPKHYQVEYENDRLRVLRVRFGPTEPSCRFAAPAKHENELEIDLSSIPSALDEGLCFLEPQARQ
jgi:hypothetical protein